MSKYSSPGLTNNFHDLRYKICVDVNIYTKSPSQVLWIIIAVKHCMIIYLPVIPCEELDYVDIFEAFI